MCSLCLPRVLCGQKFLNQIRCTIPPATHFLSPQLCRMAFITDPVQHAATHPPLNRIVSLVPSQTETLHALGLDAAVVGITKFCLHPTEWFRTKTRVGGTKNVALEKVKALQPDLVLANKEENVKEQIEALAQDFPVWLSDVNTLNNAAEMMLTMGSLTHRLHEAQALVHNIRSAFSSLLEPAKTLRTAYFIWKDPWMTVGGDTFIADVLRLAGFANIFENERRYPVVTIQDLRKAGCEVLLLSSEPYPFKEKHLAELQSQLPHTKILLADGEAFSWYGSRLLHTPAAIESLHRQIAALA